MVDKITANQVINGTNGKLWLNGELLAQVKSFESELTPEYEDIDIAGDLSKHRVLVGYEGSGTMTLHKVDSSILKLVGDSIKEGIIPDIKLVAKVSTSDGKTERVELLEVTFDKVTLVKFKTKEVQEEEVPFKFSNYNSLETI